MDSLSNANDFHGSLADYSLNNSLNKDLNDTNIMPPMNARYE